MPSKRALCAQARDVLEALRAGNDFLVAGHANPDGDSFGATAAMGWLLTALGKRFVLYNASGLPRMFDWLTLPSPMQESLAELKACGFVPRQVVLVDCGNLSRAGDEIAALAPSLDVLVNIDHHMDNQGFGQVNWVDKNFASVGEMLALLAAELDLPLTGPLGEAVYLTLVADTGYFRYENTRPETMELGAEIIRQGLKPGEFSAKYVNQWTPGRLKLWAEVLGQTKLFCEGHMGLARISQDMFARTETTIYDCDNLVDYVRRLRGVMIAVVLREEADGRTKISLRSSGDVNVQALAARFGGGGHFNAAGATLDANLDQAEAQLTELVCETLEPWLSPAWRETHGG